MTSMPFRTQVRLEVVSVRAKVLAEGTVKRESTLTNLSGMPDNNQNPVKLGGT